MIGLALRWLPPWPCKAGLPGGWGARRRGRGPLGHHRAQVLQWQPGGPRRWAHIRAAWLRHVTSVLGASLQELNRPDLRADVAFLPAHQARGVAPYPAPWDQQKAGAVLHRCTSTSSGSALSPKAPQLLSPPPYDASSPSSSVSVCFRFWPRDPTSQSPAKCHLGGRAPPEGQRARQTLGEGKLRERHGFGASSRF